MLGFILSKLNLLILVVAIAVDDFANGKSGKGRPIFPQDLRAYMIGNLKPVDFVVLDTLLPGPGMVGLIKPDVLIKGIDYSKEDDPRIIRQKNLMDSLGGTLGYTSTEKLSTTDIIKHIKENVDI